MRKSVLALFVLACLLPCFVIAESIPIFWLEEGIEFEMSKTEVKSQSTRDFHNGSSTELICNTTLYGIDASMALAFGKEDMLYEIICQFETDGLKAKYCISDFDEVTNELIDRYGEATVSRTDWTSKEAYDKYGSDLITALERRNVVFIDYWDFTDVYIVHMMAKTKSGGIQHFLDYYSPVLHPDIDKIKNTYGYNP